MQLQCLGCVSQDTPLLMCVCVCMLDPGPRVCCVVFDVVLPHMVFASHAWHIYPVLSTDSQQHAPLLTDLPVSSMMAWWQQSVCPLSVDAPPDCFLPCSSCMHRHVFLDWTTTRPRSLWTQGAQGQRLVRTPPCQHMESSYRSTGDLDLFCTAWWPSLCCSACHVFPFHRDLPACCPPAACCSREVCCCLVACVGWHCRRFTLSLGPFASGLAVPRAASTHVENWYVVVWSAS